MEGFAASNMSRMDWSGGDLPAAWKSFQQHCEFAFGVPLKGKSEEQRCNYLMIWVGEKGRDVYNTWNLSSEESKKLSKSSKRMLSLNQIFLLVTSFTIYSCKKKSPSNSS